MYIIRILLMYTMQISESPKVYVYDTPGIMLPHIPDLDVGMKLAVCGNEDFCFVVVIIFSTEICNDVCRFLESICCPSF